MPTRLALSLVVALGAPGFALSAAPSPWWERYELHSQLVTLPDGRQMKLYCEGSGAPTVIMDSGLGGGAWDWRFVQDPIARHTRVCSYDRAGMGGSDPGPTPRDTKAIVKDLEWMLAAAKVRGPYLLVGHSLGSFDVRLFADRHPKSVVGMVLVDPAADNQGERFDAIVPGFTAMQERSYEGTRQCLDRVEKGSAVQPGSAEYRTCVGDPPPDMPQELTHYHVTYGLSPAHYRTTLAEFGAMLRLDSAETVTARRSFGAMPLVVLTADSFGWLDVTPAKKAECFKIWNQMHDEIAALSSRGVNRFVPNSGHYIQADAPQVVIAAVDEVAREIHAKSRSAPLGAPRVVDH